ncbi:hypothetical protein T8K17_10630 [Thalassobaculum sp. OXR-137]|uniref:hypothetical protein n=1 Tax=Thalassobaculum sp. OXR-137 TaxID=3100173 RepID=UPI002AC8C140|nr:hypothetical protein [Thalassobaculum sp. OXR-137]WPZ36592.1 hypothetical protein T8K17_10630 [Thalassobaculum sp. OXR-137]
MHPYTAQENEWLSGRNASEASVPPLTKPVAVIDDAVIRMHMRRGERMRAEEVRRCVAALFRLPVTALRAVGAYLKPAAAKPHH